LKFNAKYDRYKPLSIEKYTLSLALRIHIVRKNFSFKLVGSKMTDTLLKSVQELA